MANVIVTSTAEEITADFGVYGESDAIPYAKGSFRKSDIQQIELYSTADHVIVRMNDSFAWKIKHSGSSAEALVIDTVDGVAPASALDLFNKIKALSKS